MPKDKTILCIFGMVDVCVTASSKRSLHTGNQHDRHRCMTHEGRFGE